MNEKIKHARVRLVGPGPDFWERAFYTTALLLGLVIGGAIGWYIEGNILALVGGAVLGIVMGLIGVGMGVKEPPRSMSGYLGYTLLFLWAGLLWALIFSKRFAVAATACIGPMLLLGIVAVLSSTLERKRDKPKLDTYFDQIRSIFEDERKADGYARERARELTLGLLSEIGQQGKKRVVSFLYEEKLVTVEEIPIDLSGADLSGLLKFHREPIQICLDGADLSKARFESMKLRGASMQNSDLSNATLKYADLSLANLSGATLLRADLSYGKLCSANLAQTNLSEADLSWASLREANLSGANCSKCNFRWADLSGTDLRGADFAGAGLGRTKLHNAILDYDTDMDDKWRTVCDIQSRSIPGRNLRNTDMSDANLEKVNLSSSDLRGVNLEGADLRGADLRHSDLTGAQLKRASLDNAYVYGAKITEEQLRTTFSPSGAFSKVDRATRE